MRLMPSQEFIAQTTSKLFANVFSSLSVVYAFLEEVFTLILRRGFVAIIFVSR